MLTLALLRHAKSSWDDPSLDDFERPLNARGTEAAPLMGGEIARLGIEPDCVLCSSSARTRQTLALAERRFGMRPPDVRFLDKIYLASAAELLAAVRTVGPAARTVLVIGHNPGLHDFAVRLTGSGDAALRDRLEVKFPTAALAVLTFPAKSFAGIDWGQGKLEQFITPKSLA